MGAGAVVRGSCGAVLFVCCLLPRYCSAADYVVGDSSGWKSGYDYSAWIRDKKFSAGDTLRFNYVRGTHSVAKVSAGDYSSCKAANATSADSSGSTTVSLTTAGTHFFICGVPEHCARGMKLAVTVGGPAAPSAPSKPELPSDVTPTKAVSDEPPTSSSCGRRVPSAALALAGIVLLEHALF